MKTKEERVLKKVKITSLLCWGIFGIMILIVSLYIINGGIQIGEDKDFNCYKSHVKECLNCHSQNLTYALCSGFCFESRIDDLDNTMTICSVHPLEDCFDLPMECNL